MLIVLRVLRVLVGAVAAWQCIGLLPVLAWLPRLHEVTIGMAGAALFKLVVLGVCVGVFYWLGTSKRKHGVQRERVNDVALAGITLVVMVAATAGIAILTPSGSSNGRLASRARSSAGSGNSPVSTQPGYGTRQQSPAQTHSPNAAVGTLPYERRAWSGNAFDQFDSVQTIEAKARSIPQLNTQSAWAAVVAWQAYFMNAGGKGANVALYMGVDHVLEGIKSNKGICRPTIWTIDAEHASPEEPAGTEFATDDCK